MTFSAPKSVSVAWALADGWQRDQIEQAHANAVQRYLHGDDPDGEGLERFARRRVAGVELETDRDRLDELFRRACHERRYDRLTIRSTANVRDLRSLREMATVAPTHQGGRT